MLNEFEILTDFVKWVLFNKLCLINDPCTQYIAKEEGAYHGMLDIGVDPGLLWVDADFDCIVHCPDILLQSFL